MGKQNISINLDNLNLSNCVKGIIPFLIFNEKISCERQAVICSDFEQASEVYEHLLLISNDNDYVLIDCESDDGFYSKIGHALKNGISIIADNGIYKKKFPSKSKMTNDGIYIEKGGMLDLSSIMRSLEEFSYDRVDNVYERGEYAIRGFVVDIFPHVGYPVRIELYNEIAESLRIFSIETQESEYETESFFISANYKSTEEGFDKAFEDIFDSYKKYDIDGISDSSVIDADICENPPQFPSHIKEFNLLMEREFSDYTLNIFAISDYEEEKIGRLITKKAVYFRGSILEGFVLHSSKSIFMNDFEIFSRKRYSQFKEVQLSSIALEDFDKLESGDIVVHQTYGVGRYAGIERVTFGERFSDCIKIFYSDNDKLFVPVDQIHLVDKYIGNKESEPKLSSLRKNSFEKQKEKVKESLKSVAGELLRLYAEREVVKGFSFNKDDEFQIDMEERFLFEETKDQIQAIEEVKRDMESDKPMDRIVCGEVGYGKTEVAARAAFKSVLSGKQVAFLVPTTILAEQHYETLFARLSPYSVRIDAMSRFRSLKEKSKMKEKAAKGEIDILIGTHALLADDMEFKNLGLYIIDEEHRFGVKQKEKLKALKKNVDVLSMTATPIPRTLEMALTGIKDISNIMTPPAGRKAIKTLLVKWSDETIKTAVLKEIGRGGQVYFLHNRIETLQSIEEKLVKMLPEIRITAVHAQMHSSDIEKRMHAFKNREFDVLLSTAIIESGIDNPNVNTMLINRADMFGLAELHQLRGRIGRSSREAFCYLIVPEKENVSENAKRRLSAFKSYSSLGAGLSLAMKDIEMRGAGKMLGTEQHGFIGNVGFSLYYKLLKEGIDELKGIKSAHLIEPTIILPGKTFVPDFFNLTKSGKTKLYRDISKIDKIENIEREKEKFTDRYGRTPEEIMTLFMLQEIKLLCKKEKISKISFIKNKLIMEFYAGYDPSIERVKNIIQKTESSFEIKHEPSFTIILNSINSTAIYENIIKLLKNI